MAGGQAGGKAGSIQAGALLVCEGSGEGRCFKTVTVPYPEIVRPRARKAQVKGPEASRRAVTRKERMQARKVERLNPQQGSEEAKRARIRGLTGPALFVIHAIPLIPKAPRAGPV
ncbi:hypothetical protein EYF80_035981 [Liparis tanakae]|uniref:Uncharacterized protein n=1 Tax=Liparis tanakae TaxID=230148 RepID=A0A4Z2GK47_9TELE|nr:hypothetical protein EYF80_035981 [Liparis tanakae]